MNEKAVSNVLGFSLILGIVILALSLVFSHTYFMINDAKGKVKYESMAQGFRKIQNIIEYAAYSKNPVKSIRLLINEGSISVNSGGEMSVSVTSNNTTIYAYSGNMGVIEYAYMDTKVAFENGGVWLLSRNPVMVSEPRIFIYKKTVNNETILFIALTEIRGSGSVGGKGFAEIEIRYNSSETKIFNTSGYVVMNITSEYAQAWKRYFDDLRGYTENTVLQTELNGSTLKVSIYFNRLVLTRYVLDTTIST
ncbi:DUF7289 family protein [Archaeoglobus veneficus]|uniref:Uncharacterized protein n=1 Tax=Archaeoglobus veneficus (strain DSM 11195 / SNP6) TaxID=693661 RepID=F2KN46_ARCVS|nr:hypothetical protein [Archaeoglobus veneficus]AEA46147.1 hypothetical protein Arcve_0106 [Archaeoglobus veneficus SNP6]